MIVSARLRGAQRATFSLADERGRFHNVLRSADESETLYNTTIIW